MLYWIKDVLRERDSYKYGTVEWTNLNKIKAFKLEDLKSTWTEKVAYFRDRDIQEVPSGFEYASALPNAPIYVDKRSLLEYNNANTRQIIPYCLLTHKDSVYFIYRDNNSDERLNGLYGLPGGHTDSNIESGMLRELNEEAGITLDQIKRIELTGIIKDDKDIVSQDHLGLVYTISLKTNKIRMEELGVQRGEWIDKSDIYKYYDRMENWLQLITKKMFLS